MSTLPFTLRRFAAIQLIIVCGGVCVVGACNALVSLDRCSSDADCPSGATCDPEGRFCIKKSLAEGAPPLDEVGAETVVGDAPVDAVDAGVEADVVDAADAAPPCDKAAKFGLPYLVSGLESFEVFSARFTSDELTVLYSALNDGGANFNPDIFYAARSEAGAPFTQTGLVPVINCNASADYWPTLTTDGTLLFFESSRGLDLVDGGCVNDKARIWSAARTSVSSEFDPPKIQNIFAIDAAIGESSPYLHPSGRSLYFTSYERGGKGSADIFVAVLNTFGSASDITNVAAVNTPHAEGYPLVTKDELTLYFGREDAVTTIRDIYVSTRSSTAEDFGPPNPVDELNTQHEDFPSWISDDECRLYFISTRPDDGGGGNGPYRLWVAQRPPP